MTIASDRPPSRSTTAPSLDDEVSRTQTGMRVKASPSSPDLDPASDATVETGTRPISPDALRRPYASLPPRAANESPSAPTRPTSTPPQSAPRSRGARPEGRWNDTTEARRQLGVCSKHNLARSPSGECLLCKKEAPPPSGAGRMVKIALITLISCGLIVAVLRFGLH